MAKFYGNIGFATSVMLSPGIYKDEIIERLYYGETLRHINRYQSSSEKVNDNIDVTNKISILADPYANENCHAMKYVNFMGANWKIREIEVQYPRLILTIGGIYNG